MISSRNLRHAALAAMVFASPALAQRDSDGDWRLYLEDDRQRVQLTFQDFDNHRWQTSSSFPVNSSALQGLSISQMTGPAAAARFQLRRDAGTFNFEGSVGDYRGRGTFTFTPNPSFPDQLARRGYSRPSRADQFELALHDVGLGVVDELAREGYGRTTIGGLVEMGQHGVTLDYVRGLDSYGIRLRTVDRLVEMRDHGVTASYIRGLADAGYTRLSPDRLVEMRDHGVTPDIVAAYKSYGFTRLSEDDLIEMRDHGVSSDFIDGMRRLGYRLTREELVAARDHGVTPAFIESF